MVLMKFSVSASSSHLHSSSLSGLVATTLRGPIEASETSLEALLAINRINRLVGYILPACNGKEVAWDRDRLVEPVDLIARLCL